MHRWLFLAHVIYKFSELVIELYICMRAYTFDTSNDTKFKWRERGYSGLSKQWPHKIEVIFLFHKSLELSI